MLSVDVYNQTYYSVLCETTSFNSYNQFTEKVAKFSLGEFNDMFSYHGLQLQEVYGDYHLAPYDVQSSPRLIMIARKIH
jgi:hypothetical protein